MEFIVNSKELADRLKEIIVKDCNEVFLQSNVLTFTNQTYSSAINVHTKVGSKEIESIDRIMWYRVMRFLKTLEEQPVTIRFRDYKIDVYSERSFNSSFND